MHAQKHMHTHIEHIHTLTHDKHIHTVTSVKLLSRNKAQHNQEYIIIFYYYILLVQRVHMYVLRQNSYCNTIDKSSFIRFATHMVAYF